MLQRIQSIYLLLASLAIFGLFLFPLVHNVYIDGKPLTLMVTGVFQDRNGMLTHTQFFTGLTVATMIVGLFPLVIIFMFKKRKRQVALCYSNIFVLFGFSFWMAQTVQKIMGNIQINANNWGIGLFLTSLGILFIVLAIKGIERDEKLVKSADRLR